MQPKPQSPVPRVVALSLVLVEIALRGMNQAP